MFPAWRCDYDHKILGEKIELRRALPIIGKNTSQQLTEENSSCKQKSDLFCRNIKDKNIWLKTGRGQMTNSWKANFVGVLIHIFSKDIISTLLVECSIGFQSHYWILLASLWAATSLIISFVLLGKLWRISNLRRSFYSQFRHILLEPYRGVYWWLSSQRASQNIHCLSGKYRTITYARSIS